jgi:hypothetical protein
MTPAQFHSALIAYCYATRASQTSGGRTPKRNALVGGVKDSNHLQWLAADVVYDEPLPKAMRDRIAARFGLEVVEEADHDHLEPK